jgi:hypothetical protein
LEKIPLMLVVGDREAEAGTVAVRYRRLGDRGSRNLDELAGLAGGWLVPGADPAADAPGREESA